MRVLLGVTGGIAAYKAADLTSRLVKAGHEVRVAMTPGATKFVGPVTFEALSAHPVMVDVWEAGAQGGELSSVRHVGWAKWAEVAVLAPLTASTIGKLAVGIADNAVTTLWVALPAAVPQILAPAMNTRMWENPAVQRSLDYLRSWPQVRVVGPIHKRLADGDEGMGALAEVDDLFAAVEACRAR